MTLANPKVPGRVHAWDDTKLVSSSPNERHSNYETKSLTWAEILALKHGNLPENVSRKPSQVLITHSKMSRSSNSVNKVAAWLESLPSPTHFKRPELVDETDALKSPQIPPKATKNKKKVVAVHRLRIKIKTPKGSPSFTDLRQKYDSRHIVAHEKYKISPEIIEKVVKVPVSTPPPSHKKPSKPPRNATLLNFFLNELNTVITSDTQRLWDKEQWQQEKTLLSLMKEKPSTIHKQISSLINECLKLTDLHLKQKAATQRHKEHKSMTSLKFAAKNNTHRKKASKIQAEKAAEAAQKLLQAQKVQHISLDQQKVLALGRTLSKARKEAILEENKEKRRVRKHVENELKAKLEKVGQDYRGKVKTWAQELVAEAGQKEKERREVESEVRRLRKQLKQELNQEMQLALQRLMQRREHRQFLKEEKAAQLMEEVRRAKYVVK